MFYCYAADKVFMTKQFKAVYQEMIVFSIFC